MKLRGLLARAFVINSQQAGTDSLRWRGEGAERITAAECSIYYCFCSYSYGIQLVSLRCATLLMFEVCC